MIKPSIALILLFSLLPQPGLTLVTPAAGNISNHPILTAQGDRELTEEQFLQRVTVRITSETNRGSGTIIAKKGDNYLILTNAHVTRNTKTLQVQTYDGHSRAARIVPNSLSENQDLALLEFSDTRDYSIATIAKFTPNQDRIGLEVVAAGYVAETGQYRTTKGTLEQVSDRPLREGYSVGYSGDIVQGMSGGGIFVDGELIGINGRSAHPILSNYIYEDGTKPTDAEIQQMRAVNWGIPINTLLTYIRPEILSAYNLPLPPVNPDIETTAYTGYIAELETKAKGFTVRIDSSSKTNGSGVIANGSGVIIAKEGNIYTVLTADHVLCGEMARTDSCADYTYTVVTSDGKTRNIEKSTIIRQKGVDLAVFQFESQDNYPVAEIANYNPNTGDFVFAAGFPKIGDNPSKWLFSGGIINDKEQGLIETRQSPLSTQQGGTLQSVASLEGGYELVYTSITFGGMSGGAVLDSQGRVIGIHGSSETAGVTEIQLGFSLGIPISTFIGLQERLKVKPQLLTTAQPQVSPQQKLEIIQAITGVIVPNTNAKADIWIERGGQLCRLGRCEEAIKAFDEAIKQNDPDNVYLAWYGKGLALGELGKAQPAIEALQQAINTLPKRENLKEFHSSILQKQSVVYRYLENYEQALTVINQAISLVPNNSNHYNEKWSVLSELKRYDEGLAAITQAIELAPRAAWYVNRGILYYNQKKYELASDDYNKAIELNPNLAMAYNNRGNIYYDQQKYELALADWNKAIELNPNLAMAYNNRGNIYYDQQKYELALADYSKAIDINPNLAMAYYNRGNIYSDLQKYDLALSDYSKAIDINPNDAKAYYNRGLLYYDLQKYELALSDYDKAIDINPNLAQAYYNRGILYKNLQKYDLALSDYSKAIEINPNYAEAYYNRGGLYHNQQKYELALSDINKAIEINPNLANAYYNRGLLYYNLQKYDLALADYTKAIELNPNYADAYNNRGILYYNLQKYDLALSDYTKAIELNPNYAEAYVNRGVLYFEQKKYELALSDYNQAIEINPNYAQAYLGRSILYAILGQPEKVKIDLQQAAILFRQQNNMATYEKVMQLLRELGR
ncbi:MAG: tetratricopeptide repeat protein [Microcystis sp. M069S2]|jgi:tetratricopeptide (TPR) repeat protein/S1-C subfamily serine protease|uniref:Serine protease n=3 Tax=Microcystis TaxID=1125 RepID=A0A552KUC9_9CHRO|nr:MULTISPECIES: serine protease [unclassified Microcystis]MCA2853505.1 tetratricopeptide repeat protein [Microcystis sp. M065S1]TRU02947.1 MAG: serine protease [Microcystis flos-aquae Ma_QC_C_20070823_S18D]TRV11584.1 MAG: serine protease [Microcystis flos-aquae Mf_QC_C_20070823_S10D]TRV28796.1 MAG: serine protease [Microcystis flos-aquae Mf_QC_C_20070823_S10]TRV34374.1 MAG: serine protease [Microcystis flos-aquae Mf_QC_C_20070823_S20D]TRV34446.1 MAG: serine protease [Microcystis flos-aquae M